MNNKAPTIRRWKAESPTIKAEIFRLLAQDFAEPKSFTELRDKRFCAPNTLFVYLEKMLKREEIVRVPVERKSKGKAIRARYNYALPDWEKFAKDKKKYDKRLKRAEKGSRKVVDRMIKLLKSGKLGDNEVFTLVYCTLLDFELKQLQGFDLLLKGQRISEIFAPSIIQDFFEVPFNLRIPFLWACYELYPDISKRAIVTLVHSKQKVLDGLAYKDLLEIYGVIKNKSG